MKKEEIKKVTDVEILFHALLFVYKGTVQRILKTGAAIFERPTFDVLRKVLEKEVDLDKGENVEEALENYSRALEDSCLAKKVWFDKVDSKKYVLHIGKCVYAKRLHPYYKPFYDSQTCTYALLATVIFQEFYGRKVKVTPSNFTEEGSETLIELS